MSNDFQFVMALIMMCSAPSLAVITLEEWRNMEQKKKKLGRLIVVPDEPDTRTQCPRCGAVKKRSLEATKTRQLNGKSHRWGTYKCGVDDCKQRFTRKLID